MEVIMKRIDKIFILFVFMLICFVSCGSNPTDMKPSVSGHKYKCDYNEKLVVHFFNAYNWSLLNNGNEIGLGTYEVKKSALADNKWDYNIICDGNMSYGGSKFSGQVMKFSIEDNDKLKGHEINGTKLWTWSKI